MKTAESATFNKIKSFLCDIWEDRKRGRKAPIDLYKRKHNVNSRYTLQILSPYIDKEEPINDTDVMRIIKSARELSCRYRNSHRQKVSQQNKDNVPASIPNVIPANGDPLLEKFHARELIAELRKRGYKGELTYNYKITL